jgi:hypothetical protein
LSEALSFRGPHAGHCWHGQPPDGGPLSPRRCRRPPRRAPERRREAAGASPESLSLSRGWSLLSLWVPCAVVSLCPLGVPFPPLPFPPLVCAGVPFPLPGLSPVRRWPPPRPGSLLHPPVPRPFRPGPPRFGLLGGDRGGLRPRRLASPPPPLGIEVCGVPRPFPFPLLGAGMGGGVVGVCRGLVRAGAPGPVPPGLPASPGRSSGCWNGQNLCLHLSPNQHDPLRPPPLAALCLSRLLALCPWRLVALNPMEVGSFVPALGSIPVRGGPCWPGCRNGQYALWHDCPCQHVVRFSAGALRGTPCPCRAPPSRGGRGCGPRAASPSRVELTLPAPSIIPASSRLIADTASAILRICARRSAPRRTSAGALSAPLPLVSPLRLPCTLSGREVVVGIMAAGFGLPRRSLFVRLGGRRGVWGRGNSRFASSPACGVGGARAPRCPPTT